MPHALIAGFGLIGGSLGMALRARGWRVSALDPAISSEECTRTGAADAVVHELVPSDIVVIATPVDAAVGIIDALSANIAPIATSVGSVMQPLRAAADRRGLPFVAGHPLAGSQERGLAAARAELFEGKPWFIDSRHETVEALIADAGARAEVTAPGEHDAAVALTSHLPQVLSTALAAYLQEKSASQPDLLRFAGSGLRTFLRLAGSDASVWAPVLEANRDAITGHLYNVLASARAVAEGDEEAFARAQELWRRLAE